MKELKFIHVTKCAGTSIENIGKDNNILWGRFHEEYGWWHGIFPYKSEELKLKYDWFMVVRNPYERLISEFYCIYGGQGKLKNGKYSMDDLNEKMFNTYIKIRVKNRSKKGDHYTEQCRYIDKNTPIHIIHFENIEFEFNELMKKYNLNIKFNRKDNQSMYSKKFTIKSFTPKLIKLINKVYHDDFLTFGYKKINPE